ncbi:hypothetical protein ThrDRAFT_01696 [Frankia casuarinae]|uniref:Uncharacterized protein n=1 Tax=Frankia casuarinae (strain DSM 45818 / CECT 9043 / HFP020203 / CcI3) TaxID=106370 RepID=Q2JEM0_FRACC|nr:MULTISPECIES: hypothetical protein [Frankia]ABD10272.1 hypothetical protein Francci3_0888 [Frankia casuarinae]ETA01975.1 hypothetical protein CcI6DRAFT_02661 [Frankia sp. CcI6]EYT92578.1 hypothetical protein ThrDRAFT_01696 [Frankia casuarinae]KFB05421.1 hypothetical protein ALLO2DRAFT_01660 [Frankia sp. Allo2]OHV54574.1 hypothetical protein CgIS1_11940 [Frankia sp. CgIS1]
MTPLQRLYRTKLTLLAVILTGLGAAFLIASRQADLSAAVPWLMWLPLSEIGSTLFGSGLIVVAFNYISEADADERANERLRKVLKEEAPAIRDAVIDGFAFAPDALTAVASPETLDRVVRNTLAIQLGDQAMADDLYADLRHQVTTATERRHDMRVSVSLSPWDKGPVSGHGSMFVATIRREYRAELAETTRRFACTSSPDEYRELLLDPTNAVAWYFEPVAGLDAASPGVFELLDFTVDGRPRPTRRSKRSGGQSFTVTLDAQTGTDHEVEIAYTYRVLVQQHGHVLYLDFGAPCKGVDIDFTYADCGIRHVNVLDFIAGAQPTRITRGPKGTSSPSVGVRYDGWVFPKSGVAFGWVLDRELAHF